MTGHTHIPDVIVFIITSNSIVDNSGDIDEGRAAHHGPEEHQVSYPRLGFLQMSSYEVCLVIHILMHNQLVMRTLWKNIDLHIIIVFWGGGL